MFKYETMTPKQREFVDNAKSVFPDLQDTISTKQIADVVAKTGIKYPQFLTIASNRVSSGVYSFPQPGEVSNELKRDIPQETEEEIGARIKSKFDSMKILVSAVAANNVNSLIIAGAPGLGKSFTVNKTLSSVYGQNQDDTQTYNYVFHRGYLRATHLFRLLWENRQADQTIVIDDCDSIFSDEIALNLLKAALELKSVRTIGWGSEKIFTDDGGEEIPRYFNYEGSIIFLTNLAFHDLIDSGSKYAPHLSALESRSLVLDLGIKTRREYLVKIQQAVDEGMLKQKGLNKTAEKEIMAYLEENMNNFRELSLRMAEKVASLYKMDKENWKTLASAVCLRNR